MAVTSRDSTRIRGLYTWRKWHKYCLRSPFCTFFRLNSAKQVMGKMHEVKLLMKHAPKSVQTRIGFIFYANTDQLLECNFRWIWRRSWTYNLHWQICSLFADIGLVYYHWLKPGYWDKSSNWLREDTLYVLRPWLNKSFAIQVMLHKVSTKDMLIFNAKPPQ